MSVDILDFFLILMNLPTKEDVSNKNRTSLVPFMAGVLISNYYFLNFFFVCVTSNSAR